MEIISNFCSFHSLIAFILGCGFILVMRAIVAMGKEPKSKVRFFVFKSDGTLFLLMKKWNSYQIIAVGEHLNLFGLSEFDFRNLEDGKRIEVFLNLED